MRKIFMAAFIMPFCISLFAQTELAHQLSKEDYLRKSKNQKTTAWILTARGGAMAITGLVFILVPLSLKIGLKIKG